MSLKIKIYSGRRKPVKPTVGLRSLQNQRAEWLGQPNGASVDAEFRLLLERKNEMLKVLYIIIFVVGIMIVILDIYIYRLRRRMKNILDSLDTQRSPTPRETASETCPICKGKKKFVYVWGKQICWRCNGSGHV